MSRACFSSVSVYCVLSYCRVRSCKREAYYSLNGRIQSCLTCSLHDTRELPLMIIRLPAGVSSRRSGPRSGLCAAVSALPLAAGSSAPDDSRPTPTPDSERQCRAMHAADRVVPWHRYDHTRTHAHTSHSSMHGGTTELRTDGKTRHQWQRGVSRRPVRGLRHATMRPKSAQLSCGHARRRRAHDSALLDARLLARLGRVALAALEAGERAPEACVERPLLLTALLGRRRHAHELARLEVDAAHGLLLIVSPAGWEQRARCAPSSGSSPTHMNLRGARLSSLGAV